MGRRRGTRTILGLLAAVAAFAAAGWYGWLRDPDAAARPLPVSAGDQEVVWLYPSTAGDAWSLFVIGLKRCEMPVNGAPSGITVDDSGAFPAQTTAVPELVVSRADFAGRLRVRWYKLSAEAPIGAWVEALSRRRPAPLAVVGGATSDRAQELATALDRQETWSGTRPLFLVTTATVDTVLPEGDDGFAREIDKRNLADLYRGRTFRFCFSNSQMVRAVSDYVLQDPTLAVPRPPRRATVFPLEWRDDPYSSELYNQFREYLFDLLGGAAAPPRIVKDAAFAVPFSIGTFARPNPGEAAAVRAVLNELPADPTERSILVLPTGNSAPARRVLLALAERVPQAGKRLVAVTGDGTPVNTFYRDAEWAWPARSIPIPLVSFTHANPVGWDAPDDHSPPAGYRLEPKTSTEEVSLDHMLARALLAAAFAAPPPGQPARLLDSADEVAAHLRHRADKFFDEKGNRHGLRGAHVVVVRPTLRYGDTTPGAQRPDATIDVYRREDDGATWTRVGTVPVR